MGQLQTMEGSRKGLVRALRCQPFFGRGKEEAGGEETSRDDFLRRQKLKKCPVGRKSACGPH